MYSIKNTVKYANGKINDKFVNLFSSTKKARFDPSAEIRGITTSMEICLK